MIQAFWKKDEKGFTLIELMIVIAIIGILAAIAVPQFMAYRMRAYNSAARAVAGNLKADEANINAENDWFGHTEAAAATTIAPTAAQGVADSNVGGDPALAIAATDTVAGARLSCTNTTSGKDYAIGTALGSNMEAQVIEDAAGDSYVIHTRHFKGDTAYGIDSDVEGSLFTVSNANLFPDNNGLIATPVAPTAARDDFTGAPGNGAPTANWTVLTK